VQEHFHCDQGGSKANVIFLGIGVDVQLGDQFCCLFGGRSLYVLHRERDFWRMRGDAYVHAFPRVSCIYDPEGLILYADFGTL
jgi:hypothetical protein